MNATGVSGRPLSRGVLLRNARLVRALDAAFRRVPLKESHKWAAAVAYMFQGEAWVALHDGMPFGATASVLAWDDVGDLLAMIATRLLHLPLFRYVDDYFAADRQVRVWSALRPCACMRVCVGVCPGQLVVRCVVLWFLALV